MADYSKWKVTDLKAELKRRGIAQTGLRVKQQFIDKLVEEDVKGDGGAPEGAPAEVPAEPAAQEQQQQPQPIEPEQPAAPQPASAPEPEPQPEPEHPAEQAQEQQPEKETQEAPSAEVQNDVKHTEEEPVADKPAEGQPQQEAQPEEGEPTKAPAPEETLEKLPSAAPTGGDAPDQAASAQDQPAAEPVEQAPADADAAAEQPAPAPVEANNAAPAPDSTTEKVAPSATESEVNTTISTPLPTEEILEDRRKRKRRSQSPAPTPEALASKRAKAQEEHPKVVLPEDKDQGAMDVDGNDKQDVQDQQPEKPSEEEVPPTRPMHDEDRHVSSPESRGKKSSLPKQDMRFKGLFAATEQQEARPPSPPPDTEVEDAQVEPALHPATPALYVGGLMRPLQPQALRNHLASIASPPGDLQSDVVVDFYLDPIKTHCFATFTNVSAASRARTTLHGTVWPDERNRKTLFVDFIPEDKFHEWIHTEEQSRGRGGPPPRWEVRYEQTDNGVEAMLGEVDAKSAAAPPPPRGREPSDFSRPPPSGPRADLDKTRRPSGPLPPAEQPTVRPGQGFKPLDELFKSTTTKPKLYYLPVSRETADRRLDRFDDLLNAGAFPRRGGDEMRRISFEREDHFVDMGPEFGARGRGGGRGGGGGGGGRRGRGGRGGWGGFRP